MYYMPPNDSQGLGRKDLNNRSHMLNLFTGIKMYMGSRLHDRDRKIRNYTSFFRLDGILPTDGLTRKTVKPISIRKTAQLTE
jgi:hypothetical protein